jgi:hypothetical protein
MQTIETQFVTVREAAKEYDTSEAGLRNRIARGALPTKKVGHAVLLERALLARLFPRTAS